jgi:hypothetical protein
MLENKILRRIVGPTTEKMRGWWGKIHGEELQNLYPQQVLLWRSNQEARNWQVLVACMRNTYRNLIGKPEGKSPLGISWSRWEDNIKIYIKEKGHNDMDSPHLAQDRDRMRIP